MKTLKRIFHPETARIASAVLLFCCFAANAYGQTGNTLSNPIVAGSFSSAFNYSNTQNTANFTNQHTTRSPNDVYYRFTLTRKMHVTMTHCGSAFDTYMHLLDASGNQITVNDDYSDDGACSSSTRHSFIQQTLEAGTYYIVSEGYGGSGLIITNITGTAGEEFNYPDIPDTYSTEAEAVGSPGGAFSVSATGGATYSILLAVPPGINGMQPSLAIVYNSQSGNGIAGWGTNLSGLSAITRAPKNIYHDGTAKGLTHLADEAYYLDGQRLIYSSGTAGQEGAVYYPESDPFTKITVHGTYNTSTANTWFEVQTANGMKYYYGNTASGRQAYYAGNSPRIHAWYLDYVEDPVGNYMTYTYYNWNNVMLPNTIAYGNNKNQSTGLQNTVTFGYESRSDSQPFFIDENVKGYMNYRLRTITSNTGSSIFRTYDLQYNSTADGSAVKFSRLATVTEKNGAGESLKPIQLNWTYLPAFSQYYQMPSVRETDVPLGIRNTTVGFGNQDYIAADLNGDGLDDLIGIFPYYIYNYYYNSGNYGGSSTNIAFVNYASLDSYGNITFTTSHFYNLGASFSMKDWSVQKGSAASVDFDGDGINELLVPEVDINDHYKNVGFYVFRTNTYSYFGYSLKYSGEMPLYATADFNNDGKGDIIFMEKGHNSNKYPGEIISHSGTGTYRTAFNLTILGKPEKMFVSDYNGDGLQDILVFYVGGYTIFWNQGNGISSQTFSDSKKTTGTNIANSWRIWTGDFNGDGLLDFLHSYSMDNKWYFALNNGNGTFVKQLACTLELYDQNFTDYDDTRFHARVFDFDHDGKSDVVITKAMYDKKQDKVLGVPIGKPWGEFNTTHTCWMRSTGSSLVQIASATAKRSADALDSKYVLGDFNGDGQPELMNYGYNCYGGVNANADPVWRMYRNSGFNANTGKVTSITDGYGAATTITYASLANDGFYTKGTGSTYPVADYKIPVYAVKSVTENNGAAGSMTANYQYKGLKAHLQGKGLLGFSAQTVSNATLGTVTESGIKAWDNSFYIPSETYARTTVDGKTAETALTLSFVDKGSKKYFASSSSQKDRNLDGDSVTVTRQFDTSFGYLTAENADFGNGMYKKTEYGDYILAGGAYRPRLITLTQKHADDASAFTQKTSVTYHTAKGYKEKTIENYGSSLPLATDYTYDAFGNVKTSKVSGSGVTLPTRLYDYDATRRFVAKAYTSPESSVSSFTYDTWGNLLTERDATDASNILTTTHAYDNWGARKSTVFPDGTKTTSRSGWNNKASKRYFTLTQGTGQPWVKTWYDNRGREVLVETVGPKSMTVQQKTVYNAKGQVSQKQAVSGNLTTTETYSYDNRGRVSAFSNSAGQNTSYKYGVRTDTTISNGRTYVKTYDAWGGIRLAADPETSISYLYKSSGKPQSIRTGEAIFSMTYYDTGLQKTLDDPNAGTITYEYDAAGRLKKQSNGRGKVTENKYDLLGRDSLTIVDGVSTIYYYGTEGNEKNRLGMVFTGDNFIFYMHDPYGRVCYEGRETGGDTSFSFTYEYNAQGQIKKINYPGGLSVNREYDAYGNLQKLLADNQPVWELTGETGTVTTTQLGGTLTATRTRNAQGLLTNLKTVKGSTLLHDMTYAFNGATGNLTSRSGMTGQTESFLYDNLDRLTQVNRGGVAVMDMEYSSNGNIDSKTGVGRYAYDHRPHAVDFVWNTDKLISANDQIITYTAFDKVSRITEKVGADDYQLDLTYGPDRQRWKSTLKKNGHLEKTTIFAGDYERIIENGVPKELYYIGGDVIYVKQQGQADRIFYACKDHLGSIVKLVDGNGTLFFQASYDAWGNRTVTNNAFNFHRGYTGHEHLPEFNLINMNGRMYDPVLARFLSPDPFVQMPDFSQNYNRYSYCLNNPFKYTDPSGENPLIAAILIGAAIHGGFYTASVAMSPEGFDNWSWKDFGYAALSGAISGAIGYYAPSIPLGGNFSLGIQPTFMISSNGVGLGMSVGLDYKVGKWKFGADFGSQLYFTTTGTEQYGQSLFTFGLGVDYIWGNGKYDFGMYSTTYLATDGSSQRVGGLRIEGNGDKWFQKFNFRYENDGAPPFWNILGDGKDRYRTAAAQLGWGDWNLRLNMMTGPGASNDRITGYSSKYPYGYYYGDGVDDVRLGALSFGNRNSYLRLGVNSEGIRHAFQNQLVHNTIGQAGFKVLDSYWYPYFYYGTTSRYSLW